jgi:acetyl esterase
MPLMTNGAGLEQFVEEARLFNEQAANYMPPMSFGTAVDIVRMREFMDAPDSPFAGFMGEAVLPVADMSIPGPAGSIPARVIRPDDVQAVYLDIHGGAWMVGSPRMDDVDNDELARACGVATVSIDYRMAPEHDLADSMDDCEAAALWLIEHGRADFGTDRLLIGGGSAGAHLAAMTLLRLRDRHRAADRFMGANLVYGCFDLSGTPSSRLRRAESWVLRPELFEAVHEYVMRRMDPEALRDPALSPLYANLSGLVPALFTVGALDPLLDDSLFMSARWEAAGNPAELAVYPESEHGFTGMPTGMARAARERQHAWARERLEAVTPVS